MTVTAFLIAAAVLAQVRGGVVELSCSDNATCIENMAKEFVRSVRQQKTVRMFDALTIEPLPTTRQARSFQGPVSRFLQSHAFSFDWNDLTLRLFKAQDRSNALDLEIFESRAAKDVSEDIPKKSKSKVEEEEIDDGEKKTPKGGIIKRRAKKKILQAVIPMMFGMKSTAAVIFAMTLVTVLTLKAWAASKLALMVTVAMAVKKLYESYSLGVGLQNHPYLYSQYPIDFPSASSHAYSVSGVSPQFPPEMYNPSALAHNSQTELLQHNDASAQQSQQAPSVQLLNNTRATERWDGKSKLQKLLEPIVEGIKSYIDPIANMFSMQTFRGMSSDVTTMKNELNEDIKRPKEILNPQPRNYAQRKMNNKKVIRYRPKKYTELNVDLDKLKQNKDLYDYVKTKKYKYNYQNTYYYPRVKYFVNPNSYTMKPKFTRLVPYRREVNYNNVSMQTPNYQFTNSVNNSNIAPVSAHTWKPIVLIPVVNGTTFSSDFAKAPPKPFTALNESTLVTVERTRAKRSLNFQDLLFSSIKDKEVEEDNKQQLLSKSKDDDEEGHFLDFLQVLSDADPISAMINQFTKYTKNSIKQSLKSDDPPKYYMVAYDFVMMTLEVIEGLAEVNRALTEHFLAGDEEIKKTKPKKKKKGTQHKLKPNHSKKKKKPSTVSGANDDDDGLIEFISPTMKKKNGLSFLTHL